MTERWSSVVVIETDGDPAQVLAAIRDAWAVATRTHAYLGPGARLVFSPPLREKDVP